MTSSSKLTTLRGSHDLGGAGVRRSSRVESRRLCYLNRSAMRPLISRGKPTCVPLNTDSKL